MVAQDAIVTTLVSVEELNSVQDAPFRLALEGKYKYLYMSFVLGGSSLVLLEPGTYKPRIRRHLDFLLFCFPHNAFRLLLYSSFVWVVVSVVLRFLLNRLRSVLLSTATKKMSFPTNRSVRKTFASFFPESFAIVLATKYWLCVSKEAQLTLLPVGR